MRGNIQMPGPAVAIRVLDAIAYLDLYFGLVLSGAPLCNPVLGREVAIAKDDGGQPGNRVAVVRDAKVRARLPGEPVRELVVADARTSVRVNVDGDAILSKVCRGEDRSRAAEGVTRGDDAKLWILGPGRVDGPDGLVPNLAPALGEAGVDFTVVCEVAVVPEEEHVCDEVAEAVASADGEHDFLADKVKGHIGA